MLYRNKNVSLKSIIFSIMIGVGFTLLTLLYSQNFTLFGLIDALFIAGFLLFAFGWFFFISNKNVFSLIVYGVQSFWLNVFGKTKDKSYIEYILEKPKISSYVYKSLWLSSIPYLLSNLVLFFID